MSTSAVERVTDQLVSGRKVWVGLFTGPPVPNVSGADSPHCTLLHLGRAPQPPELVTLYAEAAVDVAYTVSKRSGALRARVGGTARFTGAPDGQDPIVLLLQNPRIRELREWAIETAAAWLARGRGDVAGRYDYTPHVTVGRAPDAGPVQIGRATGDLDFTHVGVVCGDADFRWQLVG